MYVQTCPYNSTRLHVSPCLPNILGAQQQAGLPRFGPPHLSTALHNSRPPSSTECYGHPRNFGQPSRYIGVHGKSWVLDSHTRPRSLWAPMQSSGRPRSFTDSHVIVWTPNDDGSWTAMRYVWTPITSCGRSRKSLGAHEVLWACTRDMWTTKPRLFWVPMHISWTANNGKSWAPKHVANITHFGPPQRYLWSPTLLHWTPTLRIGRPLGIMGDQATAVLDTHEVLWTATRICGRSRMIVDTQDEATFGHPRHETWTAIMR